MRERREELEATIEATLAERFPDVELVDLEVRGRPASTLTLFIDRPGGVDLDLCAAVSQALDEVRERYALEVSSPGLDRRLRKPAHFAAALGSEVAVTTARPIEGRAQLPRPPGGGRRPVDHPHPRGREQRHAAPRVPRQGARGLQP